MTAEPGNSLPEFLSARARGSSDTRLVADAVAGLVAVVAFSFWRGPGWYMLVAAGACFLCYGTWAIANRELADAPGASGWARALLKTLAAAFAAFGLAAAVFLMLAVLAKLIGRVIS